MIKSINITIPILKMLVVLAINLFLLSLEASIVAETKPCANNQS